MGKKGKQKKGKRDQAAAAGGGGAPARDAGCSESELDAQLLLLSQVRGAQPPAGGGKEDFARRDRAVRRRVVGGLEIGAPGLYEGKDGCGKWWPVTITKAAGHYSGGVVFDCKVHNGAGRGDEWKGVDAHYFRRIAGGGATESATRPAPAVKVCVGPAVSEEEELELDAPDRYEARDANDKWWGIVLVARNKDGTFSAKVGDSLDSVWPTSCRYCLGTFELGDTPRSSVPSSSDGRPPRVTLTCTVIV
eukprot:gene5914-1312_t